LGSGLELGLALQHCTDNGRLFTDKVLTRVGVASWWILFIQASVCGGQRKISV